MNPYLLLYKICAWPWNAKSRLSHISPNEISISAVCPLAPIVPFKPTSHKYGAKEKLQSLADAPAPELFPVKFLVA